MDRSHNPRPASIFRDLWPFLKPVLAWIGVYLLLAGLWLWTLGSIITSGIKAFSSSCGHEYPVEVIFGGNWFCPKDKS
jgi:hypothetical protein